jgi:hypothetical protein
MPNVLSSIFTANHAVVWDSACASGRASVRNWASSSSLPGLAVSVARMPTVTIVVSPLIDVDACVSKHYPW